MINPNEELHKNLIIQIKTMTNSLFKGKDGDQDFFKAYETVMSSGKKMLKEEWNVVKKS